MATKWVKIEHADGLTGLHRLGIAQSIADHHLMWCMKNCERQVWIRTNKWGLWLEFEADTDAIIYTLTCDTQEVSDQGYDAAKADDRYRY